MKRHYNQYFCSGGGGGGGSGGVVVWYLVSGGELSVSGHAGGDGDVR